VSHLTSFDGTGLAVRTWGAVDAPPIVHGLGMSMDSWALTAELLSRDHRVVAYDLRGHGRSDRARSAGYGLDAHAGDLDRVLRSVVPEGAAAVVVGHSLGGGIVLTRVARSGMGGIAGVVFVGSAGSAVTFPPFPARGVPPPLRGLLRLGWLWLLRTGTWLGRAIHPVRSVSDRLVRRLAFARGEPQECVDHVRERFLGTHPEAFARTTLASVTHDGARLASRLSVPTLVLYGSGDPEVTDDDVRELLSGLPDGRLVTVPGAGHMLPLTHTALVVDQVAGWARHVSSRSRYDSDSVG
jgi:pimeloyl-ACP methyl ester carboxylesterase